MSPTDAKRNTTKRKKSKKGSGLGPSIPVGALEIKTAGSVSSATTLSSSSSPSTSSVVFSLQTDAAIPPPSNGNDLGASAPLISTERMGNTEVKKKRCGGTVNSRQTRKRSRMDTSAAEVASHVEPIDLEENASEEVVDLTCESSEPVVVDLTHNDSVVNVEESVRQRQNRSHPPPDSCVFVHSDDEEPRDNDVVLTRRLSRDLELLDDGISNSRRSGTVSCPICMDGYSEIVQSGRLIVSTKCGHIFCSQCLRDSLRNANSCPTCRKKLGYKQYHPIYI